MKHLIFDCGGVLVYPRLGDWKLPYRLAEVLGARSKDIYTSRFLLAQRQCEEWLDEARLVPDLETERRLREMLALYRARMSEPYLQGRDLIDAGLEPGPLFTEALACAHKLRLAGLPFDQQLKQTLGYLSSLRKKREKSGKTI